MGLERQLAKLTIVPFATQAFDRPAGPAWVAMFNPGELSFGRKNRYNTATSAGASQPQTSYANGEPDEVGLELFFDGTGVVDSPMSVGEQVAGLLMFTEFQPETHQPYYLHASWGSWNLLGVMTSAKVTYKLFTREGEPLRATVSITLQQVISPDELANVERKSSPDLHQTWLVKDGDTLDAIAFEVYGSPDYARPLALANRLPTMRRLPTGALLRLPPKER